MITKNVAIGDKVVTFGASAGTLRRYRDLTGRDLLGDLQGIDTKKLNTAVLENMAYVMAKQANPEMTEGIDEWLDQFDMVEFMQALPAVLELWANNNVTVSKPKKK